MDPNVIKKTQDTLGKVIKKPPLTEKLLNKPPFRFLHDIVTEVIKTNGFFKGLYQNDEMNSANVKEKEAKIGFLQKAIDCVALVTGESLSVRPSKVVAGHEPEKTNEFLQLLGKACMKKLDSKDGVKKVLAGEKPGSGSASKRRESKSKTVKEKPNEKENNINREVENNKDTINEDDNAKRKPSSGRINSSDTRKRRDSSERKGKENEAKESAKEKIKDKDRNKKEESPKEQSKNEESKDSSRNNIVENHETDVVDGNDDQQNRNIPRPSSAKGQRRRPKNDDEGDGDGTEAPPGTNDTEINGIIDSEELPQIPARRKLARPSSARPAPPRKRRQQDEADDTVAKAGSTTQVSNVIVDNSKDDEEDDTFLVEESAPAVNHEVAHEDEADENEAEGEHGSLVKKMLETKKELEAASKSKTEPSTKPLMNDAHQRKQREHAQKEIEKLRESIQTLCRSANPLGKIMDYVQEDMDSMQKELEIWREENKQHQLALKREESVTESEIEPLKSHLAGMETDVNEMLDRISTVKCNILRNEEKIQNLLAGVSLS